MLLIPTILCGGAGSRLWPVSREQHPKPFIRLNDGQSLLQKAFLRGASIPHAHEILTITNRDLYFKTQDEYTEVNSAGISTSYILEPCGKNTAAAIASAAIFIAERFGRDAAMFVLSADHLITNQSCFLNAVTVATKLALQGKIVTLGIQPNAPETGYGYIEFDLQQCIDSVSVSRFIEKPSKEKAQEYIATGRYLWNSGMFCFTASSILKQMEIYCPDIVESVSIAISASTIHHSSSSVQLQLPLGPFTNVVENAFDYAVLEPASQSESSGLMVVPCPSEIGWSDIGSWDAISQLTLPDELDNRIEGNAILHEANNCYVQSDDRLVALIGVENLMVVDTADALLVVKKSHAQQVKHIYAILKAKGHDTYKAHRKVHRPWGTYTILEEGDQFKIKRIVVKPGASLSLQMHHHRSEHWIVVSGLASVLNGDKEELVGVNQSTYIPAGNKHRLHNPGTKDLILIEVQSGNYLGEDDIIRFEDNYGRLETVSS